MTGQAVAEKMDHLRDGEHSESNNVLCRSALGNRLRETVSYTEDSVNGELYDRLPGTQWN